MGCCDCNSKRRCRTSKDTLPSCSSVKTTESIGSLSLSKPAVEQPPEPRITTCMTTLGWSQLIDYFESAALEGGRQIPGRVVPVWEQDLFAPVCSGSNVSLKRQIVSCEVVTATAAVAIAPVGFQGTHHRRRQQHLGVVLEGMTHSSSSSMVHVDERRDLKLERFVQTSCIVRVSFT